MKFLTMQFSSPSHHLTLFGQISQHRVLKCPQLMLFLNVRDQVSHPYRTTGKIIVLYILIFKPFERCEERRFWAEW
jgi:hypothetical protein